MRGAAQEVRKIGLISKKWLGRRIVIKVQFSIIIIRRLISTNI
jgi:hypothetical protein